MPLKTVEEHLPVQLVVFRFFLKTSPRASFAGHRSASRTGDSRICAQMLMTHNQRTRAANLHQNRRNLNSLAWFSTPRGATSNTNLHRETKPTRRHSHGSARTTESLRRVRLSLVSYPDSRKRVLQGLRYQVENVSNSGEPQAARPSGA